MNSADGDMPLVWITGAGGLIGNYLVQTCPNHFRPRPLTRNDVDLLDSGAVERLFKAESPAHVIHCAALSRNPVCEANPHLARRINVHATANLANLASHIPFLFFSTDLVFDGEKGNYIETDLPNPLSVYAETKAEAERSVLANPLHTIVRISLTGGASPARDRAFNEEMQKAWRAGKVLNLFVDEFRSPMAAEVTARAVWELATKKAVGIFHLCGSERLSRFQIGELLATRHPELNPQIVPGSRKDYNGPPRPPDTSLNCAKIQALLSFPLPKFSEWLRAHPQIYF